MKILCTGGAGYIGSILVEALLDDTGYEVTVLDNFAHRQASLAHLCSEPRLDIVRGDVRDLRLVASLLHDADVLIPLAAVVGAPACDADPTAATSTNLGAVLGAIQLLSPHQMIITPTTNSGYGIGEPGKECDEDTPLRPVSLYGRTKVDAEAAVLGAGGVSLRLATVFGMSPRMRLDLLVNDFTYRAVHDRAVVLFEAGFRRNYVHVRDVASAFVHAIDNYEGMQGKAFNVGLSDANLTKLDLCIRIKRHVPQFEFFEGPAYMQDPDKRDYVVSNARIERTGWSPVHTLDDGIAELVKGYAMIRNSRYGNA